MSSGAIESLENYARAAARRRTERFNHCFPRGISLADIDSHVEINHHWLFIEFKVGDQELSVGQLMDLKRLATRPRMSVWVIWTTEEGFITHGQRLGTHRSRLEVTEAQVSQKIKEWVAEVEKAPAPSSLSVALDRLFVIARLDAIRSRMMFDVIADLGKAT